ncbi:MAG: EamA family transporter [Candidatus Uhrbacteria bacterium]|nr:EamA family transporter [Candidatus Uhrbacteria bacterium]
MIIALSYIFYFLAASASPLQRRWLAKAKNAESRSQIDFAFKVTLVTVGFSLLIPLFSPFELSGNPLYLFLLALVCGVGGAGFFITSYIAQKHVEAGISSLVRNIYTPITIVLASILLNEGLTPLQIAGTILLLMAMVVVSKKHRIGRFHFDKYFMLMILGGVLLGFVLTAERALIKTTGFTTGTMLSWWSQCAALGIAALITKSKQTYSQKDIMITGTLRFLQSLSWIILLFVVGNLSVVSAVTTFQVVVVFIAAALFLHEREDMPRKIVGSIIAVIGLLLMK